jgi:NAD(P)-dependent dehydrogenase (short-subunit alcohol dehydrogenase family)
MSTYARYPSLADRPVLVTGGGSGIGASLVEHFSAQGANVAFLDIDAGASRALVEAISGAGHPAPVFEHCDLTDIEALRAAIAATAGRLGAFRVLVNNAANDQRHALEDVTPEYWDERMAVNLRHQFFAAQAVQADMAAAGGGSIVNFGSVSWVIGQGGMPGYSAAKAAVMGLTRSLARDLGPKGIRVNSIMPGWIMTERQVSLWLTPEAEATVLEHQCLKRKLYPPEIARMALFLASDDASACTSQSYIVDGGWV